jgi:hypothetical protein
MTMAGLRLAVCAGTMVVLAGSYVDAGVSVTAARVELLNAGGGEPDCSALFAQQDPAALPLHVTRLTAIPDGAPGGPVRFQWRLPEPQQGLLLADQDIPPDEQAGVIRTICTELGNGCVLTAEQLKVYDKPTILYVAPGCDALPEQAFKRYHGGRVRIRVKASAGRKKLGRGSIRIGYGRTASLSLTLDGKTGDGVRNGVAAQLREQFAATIDPAGVALPPVARYRFDNGDGDTATAAGGALQATAVLTYSTAGKHVATAEATLGDGSALCDNLLANVESAVNRIRVEVSRTPKRGSYRPGDPAIGTVSVRVRVKNTGNRQQGSAVLLEGASVLTCDTEVRTGSTTLTRSTQIDFQHCSATVEQPCQSDADCRVAQCSECAAGEICLASSHCANTGLDVGVPLGCTTDADCTRFDPTDTCVTVLPVSSVLIPLGKSVDLVSAVVPLANTLAGPAKVTETWTARAQNAPEDSVVDRYTIQSNPAVQP